LSTNLSTLKINYENMSYMNMKSNRDRIKKKILLLNANKWKSDDFDVRYFLISKLRNLDHKMILDVGGGIGIIESEMNKSNFRVNVDTSFSDLQTCLQKTDSKIHPVCASMLYLPFKENVFDIIISSHIIELAKLMDISEKDEEKKKSFLNMKKVIKEKYWGLRKNGILFLTTPNYAYHKTPNKLTYSELSELLTLFFKEFSINFFNIFPKISKQRKFNLANVMPKIIGKFKNPDEVISSLFKENSKNNYSVYFFATAKKA